MSRRPLVAVALLTAAAVSTVPAHAATTPKPKPIKGSYTVTLYPDPTPEVYGQIGKPQCGLLPTGTDKHPFKVPAAGKLHVVLDSAEVGNATAGTDWDLYVLDADGSVVDSSSGPTPHEETTDKFKKKADVVFEVCNLAGEPSGTVTYTFTYA